MIRDETGVDSTWRLVVHDSLPSTSDHCIVLAEAGESPGVAVLALRQTRGRGSRGRVWVDPPAGNLALSVLLRPEGALAHPALWPFIAGLALHEALSGAANTNRLQLKWPNDVMLDGRKLAGILVERGCGGGVDWLVIGFGANLAAAPEIAGRQVACLAELGAAPAAEVVATLLLEALDRWQAVWRHSGFEAVRAGWLEHAHPVGTSLAVRVSEAQRIGTFAGLCADGALLLSVAGQPERIETGEILLLDGS